MTPSLRIASEADTAPTGYMAVTAYGFPIVPMRVFSERREAIKWLTATDGAGQSNLARFPGATVREVTYPAPICRTVWRERNLRLVESA